MGIQGANNQPSKPLKPAESPVPQIQIPSTDVKSETPITKTQLFQKQQPAQTKQNQPKNKPPSTALTSKLSGTKKLNEGTQMLLQEMNTTQKTAVAETLQSKTQTTSTKAAEAQINEFLHGQAPVADKVAISLTKKLTANKVKDKKKMAKMKDAQETQEAEQDDIKQSHKKDIRIESKKENQKKNHDQMNQLRQKTHQPHLNKQIIKYVSQLAVAAHQKKKNQAHQLRGSRSALLNEGLTHREIQHIEKQTLNTIKKNLKQQMQKAMTEQLLLSGSPSKTAKRMQLMSSVAALIQDTYDKQKVGSKDNLNDLRLDATYDSEADVEAFVKSTLPKVFVSELQKQRDPTELGSQLTTQSQDEHELESLKKVCQSLRMNIDTEQEIAKIQAYDLGYMLFEQPQDQDGRQQQPKKPPTEYDYTEADEKEIILDRIRAILLKRAINGDLKTRLQTMFSLRKHKNGLLQLGVYNKDIENQLESEAKTIAIETLHNMLDEALMERATFYQLSGVTYKLNQQKIKTIKKNLQKLDAPISDDDFKTKLSAANKQIYPVIKQELVQTQLKLKEYPSVKQLAHRKTQLLQVIDRLQKESNIIDQLDPELTHDLAYLKSGLEQLNIDA